MESAMRAGREGGTRPLGQVIYAGFMAGPALFRVRGLGCRSSGFLTQLVPSQGTSFPICPVRPGPFQSWHLCLCRALAPGQHHGDCRGLVSGPAPQ